MRKQNCRTLKSVHWSWKLNLQSKQKWRQIEDYISSSLSSSFSASLLRRWLLNLMIYRFTFFFFFEELLFIIYVYIFRIFIFQFDFREIFCSLRLDSPFCYGRRLIWFRTRRFFTTVGLWCYMIHEHEFELGEILFMWYYLWSCNSSI